MNKHRVENEEWINARKQELEEERHRLELEKVFCKIADFNFLYLLTVIYVALRIFF